MPTTTIQFSKTANPDIVVKGMTALGYRIRSTREPLTRASRELSRNIDHQFAVGGDPKWADIKPSTFKRKGGYGDGILIRKGTLRRRATQFARWTVSSESAQYSLPNALGYGYLHQVGFTHVGGTSVPARPFIRFGSKEKAIVTNEFTKWYKERIERFTK